MIRQSEKRLRVSIFQDTGDRVLFYNFSMNNQVKTFKTIEDQLKTLGERGLDVSNPLAKNILEDVNYSHLIYKYGKHYWFNNNPLVYKKGTKIEHLKNLFELNARISSIIFEFIMIVEHGLKRATAYEFARVNSLWYLDKANYVLSKNATQKELDDLHDNLLKLETKVKGEYKVEDLVNGYMPIWLLIDHMALGQIRMLLKLCPFEDKVYQAMGISSMFDWRIIRTFNEYRNQISHGNPIVPQINLTGGGICELRDLLIFMKFYSPQIASEIINLVNNYDFEVMTNLKKQYILGYLKISKLV